MEKLYEYRYAYTSKVTGDCAEITVEHVDEEQARKEAYEKVFVEMEEDELDLVYSDEPAEREETFSDKPVMEWEL